MALQTAYNERMAVGRPGMVASEHSYDADSLIVETSAGIGFGLACGKGAADKGVVLGAAESEDFVGISVRDTTLDPGADDMYPQRSTASIMVRGDIWAAVGAAVEAGDPVYFVAGTGVLSAADSGVLVPGARWLSTQATVGGLAIVRLNGHQVAPAAGGGT